MYIYIHVPQILTSQYLVEYNMQSPIPKRPIYMKVYTPWLSGHYLSTSYSVLIQLYRVFTS